MPVPTAVWPQGGAGVQNGQQYFAAAGQCERRSIRNCVGGSSSNRAHRTVLVNPLPAFV